VNLDNLDKSKLVLKGMAKLNHEGADDVKLDRSQAEELREALAKWIDAFGKPAVDRTKKK
jgi:hypothetical protein